MAQPRDLRPTPMPEVHGIVRSALDPWRCSALTSPPRGAQSAARLLRSVGIVDTFGNSSSRDVHWAKRPRPVGADDPVRGVPFEVRTTRRAARRRPHLADDNMVRCPEGRAAHAESNHMTDLIRTSDSLAVDRVYTRAELAQMFDIHDATLNTGIFQPKGHASIWLFVTEKKTADRTQYVDQLDGDVLRWQGQTMGTKDRMIVEHESQHLELLLFYRRKKYEHPHAGFRFEGPFRYRTHSGSRPTSFLLERVVATGRRHIPERTPPPAAQFLDSLSKLHTWTRGAERAPHKPLLVLLVLARVRQGLPRLVEFREIEDQLRALIELTAPGRRGHPEYPFWRLQADGIWEVPDATQLSTRDSNSDPTVSELRDQRIQGGLPREIFEALRADPELVLTAVRTVAALLPSEPAKAVLDRLGWSASALEEVPTALDAAYIEKAPAESPTGPGPSEPDPDLYGRGYTAHHATETALAEMLRSIGVEPRSPAPGGVAAFDLLWRFHGQVFVAEVKSLTKANEERQLRLGLGQVLRYRHAVREHGEQADAVLVVECEPSDPTWFDVCHEAGVHLVWPATFSSLLGLESGVP